MIIQYNTKPFLQMPCVNNKPNILLGILYKSMYLVLIKCALTHAYL